MKKCLSLLLSAILMISVFTGFEITAYAATRSGTTGELSWSLDTGTGVFTLSGNGRSDDYSNSITDRAPWYGWSVLDAKNYRDMIKSVVIGDGVTYLGNYLFYNCSNLETVTFNGNSVTAIGEYTFYDCTGSTYWIDIPSSVTSIGSKAFGHTNFDYVKFLSPSITIADDAFSDANDSGKYSRFFGLHDSGARAFVQNGQNKGYDWHYYCLNDEHSFVSRTVAPTCISQGYDEYYCEYCDTDTIKSNYTDILDHIYKFSGVEDSNLVYTCSRCSKSGMKIDPYMLLNEFTDAISLPNDGEPYHQSNYDGRFDVCTDGYINAKDYSEILKIVKKIDTSDKQTTIDKSTSYQTIEGFGASAAWWAQDVGGWDNLDEIMNLLYGDEEGIGLNIYRYNLGAGSENDDNIPDWHRRAEDFLDENSNIFDASTYDWNADANALNALASAQRANCDLKVTLFSNSAPVSLTDNGKAYCSNGASSNLSRSNYQAFAQYVVNCAEHFTEEGYNVTCVSPINEPEWAWAADENGSSSQEGCHWESEDALDFYNNYMIPALKSSSLNNKTELSVWECAQLNHKDYWNGFLNDMFSSSESIIDNWNYGEKNQNIRDYVNSLDTHSYWASESDRNAVASQLQNSDYSAIEKIRCTEYCQMTNDTNTGIYDIIGSENYYTQGLTIEYGIALADIIYQDLTILNAVEWDWWTACSGEVYPDGLVYINYDDHSDVQTSKRLWCLGNYSKFIDDGAVRVSVSTGSAMAPEIKQSAYVNPDGSVAVVYINSGDTTCYTSFDNSEYSTIETYVTDESHDLELYQSGANGDFAVSIPAKSVTTVLLNR